MSISNLFSPNRLLIVLLAMFALVADSTATAQGSLDRIRRRNGTSSGKITGMNPLGVTIAKGGVATKVPAEEIRSVYFAGEPSELNSARVAAERGRHQEALEKLASIAGDELVSDFLRQEVDYYILVCQANMSLAGQGEPEEARKLAKDFMAKYSRSSFHVLAVIELLGDLLVASGELESARSAYGKLAKAPSPYYQAQSALLVGRAWQAEGKHREAIAEFDRALAMDVGAALGSGLKLEATLHKSISQSATGEAPQAAATVKQIISQADAEDTRLLARAYNALGDCHLQSGENQAALFAFLHVDLLYSSSGEDHAKSLRELARLWATLGRADRAKETQQKLKTQYPKSRWAAD